VLDRRRALDGLVGHLVGEAELAGDIRADVDPKLAARLLGSGGSARRSGPGSRSRWRIYRRLRAAMTAGLRGRLHG